MPGFIGGNFVLDWLDGPACGHDPIINLDTLTYSGNRENLALFEGVSIVCLFANRREAGGR